MDGRVFLELLARDAMPVDYEDVVARARAGGLDPTSLAELERDKLLAMRVRSALERRRRREAELSALFEIACPPEPHSRRGPSDESPDVTRVTAWSRR